MVTLLNDGADVFAREMPAPVVCWIVPPLLSRMPLATVLVPVTARWPDEPVLLSTMPLAGSPATVLLPDEMSWNVKCAAPMVVLETFNAVALVELIVLPVP